MTLNPDNATPPSAPEPPSADPVRRWAFLSWIAAVLTLALLLWLNFPTLDQLARGIYTPTPAPPIRGENGFIQHHYKTLSNKNV